MKKRGKYEKMPAVPAAAEAKKTILQTYVTSLISLMLCVTMFFGTTAAWFTSEVESVDNEIYVGILDVDLMKKTGVDGEGKDIWTTLKREENKTPVMVFDSAIKWEPNATAIETLKVKNLGDLSFQYRLSLIPSETMTANEGSAEYRSPEEIKAIASQFEVYVRKETPTTEAQTFAAAGSIADLTEANGWTLVGTLAEVLNGKDVFEGFMDKDDVNKVDATTKEKVYVEHIYSIALHMKSNATGMYKDSEEKIQTIMGKRLYLNVKLVAAQNPSEKDEFGDTYYDEVTEVINAEELQAALEQGGNVVLMNDIDLLEDEQITIPAGVTAILDLNGHTITAAEYAAGGAVCAIKNEGTLTIEGDGDIVGNGYTALYSTGNLTVNGGNYTAGENFGLLIDNIDGTASSVAVINGGTFSGVGIYNPTEVTINGGTFKVGRDPDGATDAFTDVTLYVSPTSVPAPATAIVTLEGGTFTGNVYINDGGVGTVTFENKGSATIQGEVVEIT